MNNTLSIRSHGFHFNFSFHSGVDLFLVIGRYSCRPSDLANYTEQFSSSEINDSQIINDMWDIPFYLFPIQNEEMQCHLLSILSIIFNKYFTKTASNE